MLGAGLLAVGCGGGAAGRTSASLGGAAPDQVTSTQCLGRAGGTGAARVERCVLVLVDGRRYRCPGAPAGFVRSTPAGTYLDRTAGCLALKRLAIPPATRVVFAALGTTRACLAAKGLGVTGGPVLPSDPHVPYAPDGELIVGTSAGGAFVAFYRDLLRARRGEPQVARNARRFGGLAERSGAVTVVWIHPPPPRALRQSVQACAFGAAVPPGRPRG